MNKQEFLAQLRMGLSGLSQREMEERLSFYSEMIDDRMEEGLTQAEAICQIGTVDEILSQCLSEHSPAESVKPTQKPQRKWKAWEIVLLALGCPIWLSLGIAAIAVILSLYVSLWAVIVSLWSVFGSLIGCALGGLMTGIGFAFEGYMLIGIAALAAGLVCAGLSIFAFYACKAVTKGMVMLTKKIAGCIKNCFAKKEESK